jgi:lysophospholipase L1-like esterase
MPADFNPRVWWVALGMNDLGRMQCSEEVVILGILRVVEEILTRKPDAEVVINSMLPMADLRGGLYPQMADYKDAFRQYKGRPITNPQLIAMKNAGAVGPKGIHYSRPSSTTDAIRDRVEKRWRDRVPGGPGYKGPPLPKESKATTPQIKPSPKGPPPSKPAEKKEEKKGASRRRSLKVSRQEKKEQKKKEKEEEAKEGDISKQNKGDSGVAAVDKQEIKKMEQYLKKVKKDPVNPKMNLNKSRIKARDASKVFITPTKLPLWTSIHAINEELRKFAEKHERVHFFDATKIFAERDEGSKWILMSDKISIRGHPTELGFELWQDAMALKLKDLLEKDDIELAKRSEEERNAKIKKEKADDKSPEEDVKQVDEAGGEERF